MSALPTPPIRVLKKGQAIIARQRYGVIEHWTSAEVVIRVAAAAVRGGVRDPLGTTTIAIPWAEFATDTSGGFLLDPASTAAWTDCLPRDRTILLARLAIVCLMRTGCRSGHEGLAEPDEPFAGLRLGDPTGVVDRSELIVEILRDTSRPWVLRLLLDLAPKARRSQPSSADLEPPSARSIRRWEQFEREEGVWSLLDNRGGSRLSDALDAEKRRNTEALLNELIEPRGKTDSATRPRKYFDDVQAMAATRGLVILGRTVLYQLVRQRLLDAGHKPQQVKSAGMRVESRGRQSNRPPYLGQIYAFDAGLANNFVRATPNGKPFRPYIHLTTEAATGAYTAAHASGRYGGIQVAMMLHDAFRPFVLLADPGGRPLTSIKGSPQEIHGPASLFKPGVIPAKLRSDNAKQNHCQLGIGIARLLGADVIPSRPGMSKDNGYAEVAQGILSKFYERMPGFVGRNTDERAEWAGTGPLMSLAEYEAELQRFCYVEHNHGTSPLPHLFNTGITRMQHWDLLLDNMGELPMLLDHNALFSFFPRKIAMRTAKGIKFEHHRFDCRELWQLDQIGPDRLVEIIYDPRRLDCIWVEDPRTRTFHEIPNILRDFMNTPLTREITRQAMRTARQTTLDDPYSRREFARHAELTATNPDKSVRIERDLGDWAASARIMLEALRNGLDVTRPSTHPGYATDFRGTATAATPAPDSAAGDPLDDWDWDTPLPKPGDVAS